MAFLSVPETGGETYFPRIDVKIPPRAGSLVMWNNLDAKGEPNTDTLHQGLPVLTGTKHIITKWYRERPWGWKARRAGPRWATAFRAAARCLRAELPMSKADTGGLDP